MTNVLCMIAFCKFGLVRSLLSKCVEPQETGKIFSGLAIVCALMPTISNPVFRQLYNWTLPYFPGAYMIMAALVLFISALLNFYLYTQRHRMVAIPKAMTLDENIGCEITHI